MQVLMTLSEGAVGDWGGWVGGIAGGRRGRKRKKETTAMTMKITTMRGTPRNPSSPLFWRKRRRANCRFPLACFLLKRTDGTSTAVAK